LESETEAEGSRVDETELDETPPSEQARAATAVTTLSPRGYTW